MHFPASPVTVVRQFFSSMLMCPMAENPLACVFQDGDYTEGRVHKVHQLVLAGDGAPFIRLEWVLLEHWPTRALTLADHRRSDHACRRHELGTIHHCCCGYAGTGTILRIAGDV